MKKAFTILMAWMMVVTTWAVPARPALIKHTQQDGTTLLLRLVGDEYAHYYLSVTDGEKMYRGADGDFYALTEAEVNRSIQQAQVKRRASNERRMARMKTRRKVGSVTEGMIGNKKGIVLLVNFKDTSLKSSHTQTTFNNLFNKEGYNNDGHIGSVRDYFKDQSYGQFILDFDVVGPLTVSNNMSYYGGNDSNGDDKHPAAMVIEACKLADQKGVDFSQYDWDGDGYVDQVFVIYAGYGENYNGADENTIWPHEYELSSASAAGDGSGPLKVDGVTVNTYACCAELSGTSGSDLNGIGTACHEFSHCLGYPDTYDIDYSGGIGMDCYDVMCSGSYNGPEGRGEVPCGYTAYERWTAGWLTPEELAGAATITHMKDLGENPQAYVIYNSANTNEFFLIENRQNTRWFQYFDTMEAGKGLFISHIDYNAAVWANNTPNDTKSHQRVTWVPADKNYGTYSSTNKSWSITEANAQGDFFPGTKNVTSFNPSRWGSYGGKWFTSENGSYYSSHVIADIEENDGEIGFVFDGGDDGTRYRVTYEAGGGDCTVADWVQTKSSTESTTLPSCSINAEKWTFAGWSTSVVEETTTSPTLLKEGASYTPTADCTLYAVYVKSDQTDESGAYTLDYGEETNLQKLTMGYGNAFNYTATDGGEWVIKAYKYNGLQLNKGKNASVKVPVCPGNITTIEITCDRAKTLEFSTSDYTGSSITSLASATGTNITLDLSGKNVNTGYIYASNGATSIAKVVVNYGNAMVGTWATYPTLKCGEINISQYENATFSLPTAYIMPEGLTGAYVKATGTFANGFTLSIIDMYQEGDVVPAGEALLIKGAEGKYDVYSTSTDKTASSDTQNDLCAVYKTEDGKFITSYLENYFDNELYYYKLTTKGGENFGWYWGAADGGAFAMSRQDRAYLVIERSVADKVKSMTMTNVDKEETSLEEVNEKKNDNVIFDLTGRRLNSLPQKGIYIKNGQKHIHN